MSSRRAPWSRSSPRTTALPAALAAVVVAMVALSGACSSNGPAAPPAADAATAVVDTLLLPDDTRPCLEERFEEDETARAVLVADGEPGSEDLDALARVVEACVDPASIAAGIAERVTIALPPTGTEPDATASQQDCLDREVRALDAARRRTMVVGLLLVANAPQTGDLAVARGDVLNGLYDACSVTVEG